MCNAGLCGGGGPVPEGGGEPGKAGSGHHALRPGIQAEDGERRKTMRIVYLPESDSMWIKLDPDAEYDESEEVAPGTVLDFGKDGSLIAIEIYKDASKKVDLTLLAAEGIPVEARPAPGEVGTRHHS